jgi:dihydroorotase
MKIAGTIATHDKKPCTGIVTIDEKTGLITDVKKTSKKSELQKADYFFNTDNLIFAGFGDIHIHAREEKYVHELVK